MKIRKKMITMPAVLAVMVMALTSTAAGGLISDWDIALDLQQYETGLVRDMPDWNKKAGGYTAAIIEDPVDAENHLFAWGGPVTRSLTRAVIGYELATEDRPASADDAVTYFTRFKIETPWAATATRDISWGLSRNGNDYTQIMTYMSIDGRETDDNTVAVHARSGDGKGGDGGAAGWIYDIHELTIGEWYNFWIVCEDVVRDGAGGIVSGGWSLYINSGNNHATQDDLRVSNVGYRVSNVITDINHIYWIDGNVFADGKDNQAFHDDWHFSKGVNLTLIPEPGTIGLLGLAGLVLFIRRRFVK